ncbi:MAG: adenylate/guanylate cyclase domain-containing protein [Pseudomonadota bacterium]
MSARSPQFLFRCLGFGGLALILALELTSPPSAQDLALLLGTAAWPLLWLIVMAKAVVLAWPGGALAGMAHAGECVLVLFLTTAAGLPPPVPFVLALLYLVAITALGGLRLFWPAAMPLALVLLVHGGHAFLPGVWLGAVLLMATFLLTLAWLSFARVRKLSMARRFALAESRRLAVSNEHLARYLPASAATLPRQDQSRPQAPSATYVTVAFVDVVGFAELVASRPPAELADVLGTFMGQAAALAECHGGEVGKFLGDGVLVYFDERRVDRWQGARGAADFALALEAMLLRLGDGCRRRGLELRLAARVGLASGYCALGDWGARDRLDYTLIGTAVNLASRLQSLAPPGGILLAAETAGLLEALGLPHLLVGAPEPLEIRGLGVLQVHGLCASAKVRATL